MAFAPLLLRKGQVISRPPPGVVALVADASGALFLMDSSGNLTPAGGGVAMIDTISTAVGDSTDLTVSGLNGDTDGNYEYWGQIIYKGGSGFTSFNMRPFATDESNLKSLNMATDGSGTLVASTSGAPITAWRLINENNAGDVTLIFRGWMTSKTGRIRQFYNWATSTIVSSTSVDFHVNGWANDTATVISALTIHSTIANAIRAGSFLAVRALKQTL